MIEAEREFLYNRGRQFRTEAEGEQHTMKQLFESARLGPMTLPNRIVRSATNEHLSQRDGQLSEAWVAAQEAPALGGVGLIITGHFTVERTQRADEGQPVLDGGTDEALLARGAQRVHDAGAKIVLQLSHSGLKAPESLNGCPAMAPADFTKAQLDTLVTQYRDGALLCQKAGFDGVQVHCAHGYLLSNFLDSEKNTRTDEYGGTLSNRFRLPGRIIAAIRAACGPNFAILTKVDSDLCGDLHGLLRLLEGAGVDGAEVSGGDFNTRKGQKTPFYLDRCLGAAEGLTIPVFPVGGVFDLESANRVLTAGFPFVSLSRSLICQPDFPLRMQAGETSKCLACNGCYTVYRTRPVRCILHEQPLPQLEKVFGADG